MPGPVVSENLHLSIYLWANDKPARGLIAKFQLCQVPANQPVLPGLLKPGSLLTRLKEGTSRCTPSIAGARNREDPGCVGRFFSRSVTAKKKVGLVPCFRFQP